MVGVDRALKPSQLALELGERLDAGGAGVGVKEAAVDPDTLSPDEVEPATQLHEVAVQRLERLGVIATEVGNAVVARTQTTEQPNQLWLDGWLGTRHGHHGGLSSNARWAVGGWLSVYNTCKKRA